MNEVIEEFNQTEKTDHGLVGPGSLLREAREAHNMTPSDVASKLYLTSRVIEGIESDDYHQGPQHVFVRGYLRSYATLVGLSADDVIEAFNQLNIMEKSTEGSRWHIQNAQAIAKEHWIRRVSLAAVAGLMVFVALWWHTQKLMQTGNLQSLVNAEKQEKIQNQGAAVTELNDLQTKEEHAKVQQESANKA